MLESAPVCDAAAGIISENIEAKKLPFIEKP